MNNDWKNFACIPYRSAGPVGSAPETWVKQWRITGIPQGSIPLPNFQLTRNDVRRFCQNENVLFGYVCAMAWGKQGARFGNRHVSSAWANRQRLESKLKALRAGGLTRCEAYNLFAKRGETIPGLGPAFFTKLLYFFSPTDNFYIMDQWTAKSVNLLAGKSIVKIQGDAVANTNTSCDYVAYCKEVDSIASHLAVTGEQAEEMLMSKGGNTPWPWRDYLRKNWKCQPTHEFSCDCQLKAFDEFLNEL